MALKIEPKLLKKVNQGKLILAAKDAGVKNVDKLGKAVLATAFIEKFEELRNDEEALKKLDENTVNFYNQMLVDLGLADSPPAEDTDAGNADDTDTKKKGGKKAKAPKTPKAPKAPKEAKEPKYTREKAIADVISSKMKLKTPTKIKDMCFEIDEKYQENGGTSHLRRISYYTNIVLSTLEATKAIEMADGAFKFIQK
jgi:hypothetical protein